MQPFVQYFPLYPIYPCLSTLFSLLAVIIYLSLALHQQFLSFPLLSPLSSLLENTYLAPCPLSPDWQPHRMSPPPITPHIPQSRNIIPQLPPQLILYFHR
jgi:hypothetical protein